MTDGPRTLREKAVSFVINQVISHTNRQVDIRELQRRHKATEGRVTKMTITDISRSWHFRVADGRLEYLDNPGPVDGGFELSSDTLIALAMRRQKVMDPATGAMYDAPFTPLDALTRGSVRIWGEAAMNDMLLFARAIYSEVAGVLSKDLRATVEGVGRNGA